MKRLPPVPENQEPIYQLTEEEKELYLASYYDQDKALSLNMRILPKIAGKYPEHRISDLYIADNWKVYLK